MMRGGRDAEMAAAVHCPEDVGCVALIQPARLSRYFTQLLMCPWSEVVSETRVAHQSHLGARDPEDTENSGHFPSSFSYFLSGSQGHRAR